MIVQIRVFLLVHFFHYVYFITEIDGGAGAGVKRMAGWDNLARRSQIEALDPSTTSQIHEFLKAARSKEERVSSLKKLRISGVRKLCFLLFMHLFYFMHSLTLYRVHPVLFGFLAIPLHLFRC